MEMVLKWNLIFLCRIPIIANFTVLSEDSDEDPDDNDEEISEEDTEEKPYNPSVHMDPKK